MPIRATLDYSVIATWKDAVASHNRRFRPLRITLWAAFPVTFALSFVWTSVVPVVLFFACPVGLIALFYVERSTLLCPHCGESPVASSSRDMPTGAEFCAHCYYWLNPPQGLSNVKSGSDAMPH